MLLTNDGDLAGRLLHPRFHVEKEYQVRVRGVVGRDAIELLRRGVPLEDGMTAPAAVQVLEVTRPDGGGPQTSLKIVVHEGRKRQVRRMLETVGHRVVALHRSRFDGLTDTGLLPGQARRLVRRGVGEAAQAYGALTPRDRGAETRPPDRSRLRRPAGRERVL